ncbi:MAG TPA: hypothetical protein VFE62_18675 [Gemmataceae bacterium]|nr:hypothetical protein [Gemmataceae bacterium]
MATAATDAERAWVLDSLSAYWGGQSASIAALPLPRLRESCVENMPPRFVMVELPEWSRRHGIDGALLVPTQFVLQGDGPDWARVDWLGCAFWYLHAVAERVFELAHGPIHSYRFRLGNWDDRHWDHAWVNRIALFLREWGARAQNADAARYFGPLPRPEIVLTHDVDAVRKTMAISFKQSAFRGFNALRSWTRRRWREGAKQLGRALRFLVQPASYWRFDDLLLIEKQFGRTSRFNFYGGSGSPLRRPRDLLFDPGYSVETPAVRDVLRTLRNAGHDIGLHPSFAAWNDPGRMASEKARLEAALGAPVDQVRMHWLRFSWRDTWRTQIACNLRDDSTLAFNDRPGFRVAAALTFHPWDAERQAPLTLSATPMGLMDSQVYDYNTASPSERQSIMAKLIREVHQVAGTITINWHPHVLSPDFGWADGYREFLQLLDSEKCS